METYHDQDLTGSHGCEPKDLPLSYPAIAQAADQPVT